MCDAVPPSLPSPQPPEILRDVLWPLPWVCPCHFPKHLIGSFFPSNLTVQ